MRSHRRRLARAAAGGRWPLPDRSQCRCTGKRPRRSRSCSSAPAARRCGHRSAPGIVVTTFTNAAAQELRERLRARLAMAVSLAERCIATDAASVTAPTDEALDTCALVVDRWRTDASAIDPICIACVWPRPSSTSRRSRPCMRCAAGSSRTFRSRPAAPSIRTNKSPPTKSTASCATISGAGSRNPRTCMTRATAHGSMAARAGTGSTRPSSLHCGRAWRSARSMAIRCTGSCAPTTPR